MKCERFQFLSMPGHFNKNSDILFIGQNPGQLKERASGWSDKSYSEEGASFKKFQEGYTQGLMEAPLGKWLEEGIQGQAVWSLTNIVKCRTPNNAPPLEEEVENCRHWLEKQIALIKPKVIVTLGNPAYEWFQLKLPQGGSKNISLPVPIGRARGRAIALDYSFFKGLLIPTYHPAYMNYRHDKFSFNMFQKIVGLAHNQRIYQIAMQNQRFTQD